MILVGRLTNAADVCDSHEEMPLTALDIEIISTLLRKAAIMLLSDMALLKERGELAKQKPAKDSLFD